MKMFQDLCEWLRRQLFFAKLRAKEDIESVIRLCKVDSILISLRKEKERLFLFTKKRKEKQPSKTVYTVYGLICT